MSTPASPASHSGPDVYILPLTEVSLPVAKQPGRSVQLLRSTDLGRQSLLYIKEIGHGWFGKVLLGEVHSGLSSTQVVVKELKASASVQDQMHFLEEARPYRSLQHPALVQCLAQCTEVTPYLVVMEFCPLGDVKGYLCSCRTADSLIPDPLLLQRMACEITSGLLHLHKNNFTHRDLALRNCLLTSDIKVKIGDYGLSHNKYKDDYFVTSDQTWVPLRWIAPELVDEVHGNLLVVDQTKESNIWSLGVTIWELFELGNQPYRHYSDRQVLSYAVKDQQLKLSKPILKYPLADRWYEVMQFCWLQPDQRPNAEEVHLLLSYLCAKGASEAEEDFERRWNSMRPNTSQANLHGAGALAIDMPMSSTTSSFPLLEQFPSGDGYHSESGDDILTVTETSHGLNFEYKWEQARAEQHYHSSSTTGTLGQGNPHCQEVYYPPGGIVGGCAVDGLALGVSPSYYEPKQLHTPGVVPVLSAHSPSVSNEYYIRIEEPVQSNIDMNFTMCAYSPEFGGSNGSFLTGSGDSGECMNCPPEAKPDIYWSAEVHKSGAYDSDSSPAMSLTMEPLLGHGSPLRAWESGHYVSYKDRDGGYYFEPSPPKVMGRYMIRDSTETLQESWGSRSLRQALGELEDPLGISPSLGSPPQGYADPYLESIQGSIIGKNVTGGYYDMMGSLRKTMPGSHSVCTDIASGGAVFVGRDDSESDEEEDIFVERRGRSWSASNPPNTNPRTLRQRQGSCIQDSYADFHYTMPMTDIEDTWPEQQTLSYHMTKPVDYLEAPIKSNTCLVHGRHVPSNPSPECNSYIHMCHEPREAEVYPVPCCQALSSSHFVDPLTGTLVRNCFMIDCIPGKTMTLPNRDQHLPLSAGHIISKIEASREGAKQFDISEQFVDIAEGETNLKQEKTLHQDISTADPKTEIIAIYPQLEKSPAELSKPEPESELSKTADSGMDRGHSSISLVEIDDCSDDDITDVTSGIFGDFAIEVETVDYPSPAFKSLQKQVGTPDSMDSIDIPSTACSSETLSPASIHPSSSPKTVDSGYDTENNESPEFVLKEPHEVQDSKTFIQPLGKVTSGTNFVSEDQEIKTTECEKLEGDFYTAVVLKASESSDGELKALSDKTPYRDSAYFSDYDAGKDKESEEDINELEDQKDRPVEIIYKEEQLPPQKKTDVDEYLMPSTKESEKIPEQSDHSISNLPSKTDESLSVCDKICSMSLSPHKDVSTIKSSFEDNENIGVDSDLSAELLSSEESDSGALLGTDAEQEESFKQVESEDSLSHDQVAFEGDLVNKSKPEVLIDENEEDIVKDVSCAILSEEGLQSQKETAEKNDSPTHEELKSKSKDCEGEGRKRISARSGSPPPPLEGRVSPTDGEEADEEDGDSEDSDESDEELRTYSIQEQSEESEDEVLTVPIIISDCSDAHKLRSLLKMPTSLLSEETEGKKKVVSFFDDVTVYLFDQESPTRELADHSFPLGGESSKPSAKGKAQHQQDKVNASDDSSDGNISEESAGFEWEDDFPLLPLPTSSKGSPPDHTEKPNLASISPKPVAQVSRFTVSPSSVSRFSITHVSDSDMDSAGGSSEDGEKE